MGPCGSKSEKTLSLPQIAFEYFQPPPEFSYYFVNVLVSNFNIVLMLIYSLYKTVLYHCEISKGTGTLFLTIKVLWCVGVLGLALCVEVLGDFGLTPAKHGPPGRRLSAVGTGCRSPPNRDPHTVLWRNDPRKLHQTV